MNMSDENRTEYQVQRWQKNKERALTNKWYAIARIDLLIVSISGGGIYIIFELIKYFYQAHLTMSTTPIKYAALFFTFAIITNFVSQFFGSSANNLNAKFSNIEFKHAIGEQEKDMCDLKILQDKIDTADKWVNIFNVMSVCAMFVGIIILVVYNFNNL